MSGLYILSSLVLAGLSYSCSEANWWNIWYPWGILFHLMALFWIEDEIRFFVVYVLNAIVCIALAAYIFFYDLINPYSFGLIGLHLAMMVIQLFFRTKTVDNKQLLIVCTLLILPFGFPYGLITKNAIAHSTSVSLVANGWFKPTTEINQDVPNKHRQLISRASMSMRENDPGTINAKVAAQYINHKVIYYGKTFSFNEIVGPRTEKRGFVPSSSYMSTPEGTISVPDIGGGICRTSTLLNQIVLDGKLQVVEHQCHTATVRYAAPGEDTAVAWPDLDYKFTNNRFHAIEIVTKFEKNTLIIELWGL